MNKVIVMMNLKIIFAVAMSLGGIDQSLASTSVCDVLKLEAKVRDQIFAASGVVIDTREGKAIVTADHFIPTETPPQEIIAIRDKEVVTKLVIRKRDWSSDLIILKPTAGDGAKNIEKLKACEPSVSSAKSPAKQLIMKGYPLADRVQVSREAALIDDNSSDVRVSQMVSLIKVKGAAELGLSGGSLEEVANGDGAAEVWHGLLIKSWDGARAADTGGAYALPADWVLKRVGEMLTEKSKGSLEMPMPFSVHRETGELHVFGFRFRNLEQPMALTRNEGGGGHPDGIGGAKNRGGLEVLGLSGQPVVVSVKPMERILRSIQGKGGIQMLVRQTTRGDPLPDLIALGRAILVLESNPNATSAFDLDYELKNLSSEKVFIEQEDVGLLLEQAVLQASLIANVNPNLQPLADLIKQAHRRWVFQHSLSDLQKIFSRLPEFQAEMDKLLDIDVDAWKVSLELQATLIRLKK